LSRKYWVASSDEDFAAAQSLFEKGHLRHSLFFAHLAIEKLLKAHIVRATRDVPPRIHDLVRLFQITALDLGDEQKDCLLEFGAYQLEGRYPDSQQMPLDKVFVNHELIRAGDILGWLKTQLPV
jgi:HEPN domain-containing protein